MATLGVERHEKLLAADRTETEGGPEPRGKKKKQKKKTKRLGAGGGIGLETSGVKRGARAITGKKEKEGRRRLHNRLEVSAAEILCTQSRLWVLPHPSDRDKATTKRTNLSKREGEEAALPKNKAPSLDVQ